MDAIARLWFPAQGEEGLALEVEHVLLADGRSRGDGAAGDHPHELATHGGVVVGLVMLILFHNVLRVGESLVETGALPPIIGLWLPAAIFAAISA